MQGSQHRMTPLGALPLPGHCKKDGADRLLVHDHQQPSEAARTEKQLPQRARIRIETDRQDPGAVAAEQRLHVAIKAFGAVVGKQQKA